jgi:hypothetical protein
MCASRSAEAADTAAHKGDDYTSLDDSYLDEIEEICQEAGDIEKELMDTIDLWWIKQAPEPAEWIPEMNRELTEPLTRVDDRAFEDLNTWSLRRCVSTLYKLLQPDTVRASKTAINRAVMKQVR